MPFPAPGDLPDAGIEPASSVSPAWVGGFFTTEPPGKPPSSHTTQKFTQNERVTVKDPKVKVKTVKLFEENIAINPHDLVLGKSFLNMTSKAQQQKEKKIEKLDIIKIKKLLCCKGYH